MHHGKIKQMDSFESLISLLLRREGYWTITSFKVDLSHREKRSIGRSTSPRWEIDLLAYKGKTQELLAIECKSYLDSKGVDFRNGKFDFPKRYKLFNERKLRQVVLKRLAKQLSDSGACPKTVKPKLCLATGKIANVTDRSALKKHFDKNGWKLFNDLWIKDKLKKAADAGYENEISLVVAKLLNR